MEELEKLKVLNAFLDEIELDKRISTRELDLYCSALERALNNLTKK